MLTNWSNYTRLCNQIMLYFDSGFEPSIEQVA